MTKTCTCQNNPTLPDPEPWAFDPDREARELAATRAAHDDAVTRYLAATEAARTAEATLEAAKTELHIATECVRNAARAVVKCLERFDPYYDEIPF